MSMDKILKAEEQQFVSEVVSFQEFCKAAKESRDRMEKAMCLLRDPDIMSKQRFAMACKIPDDFAEQLLEHVESIVEGIRDPTNGYNFEIERGFDDQVLPCSRSRISQLLQWERERRLNKQNKSIALRAMRYDFMGPHLLTLGSSQRNTGSLDMWMNIITGKHKLEPGSILDADEDNNNDPSKVLTPEQQQRFLRPDPGSLRSQYLPWGDDELIVHTSVYLGYSRTLEYHEIRLGRLMKVTDSLILSGKSTLYDLKRAFHCPADYHVLGDVSYRNITQDDLCKNRFPSSYFFIHDTFYIDMRPEGSSDISQCIRDWAVNRPGIGEMKVAFMGSMRLGDLHCRLGQPYVYVHQGNCEHLICFTDLHLRSLADNFGPYPIRLMERNFRRITCAGCRHAGADWSVMDCEILPTTPLFVCNFCYKEFFFTSDGNKRVEFTAVPYFDRKAMDNTGRFLNRLQMKAPIKKTLTLNMKRENEKNDESSGAEE